MTSRLALVSLLALVGTAHAQAPGEWTAPEAPAAAPVAAPMAPPAAPAQKWSIGVAIGQTELTADGDAAQASTFDGAAIALRYRGWQHLELELSLGGGRETLEDGTEGMLAMGTGTLAARYRFHPERAWNWWLLGGIGMTTVAAHDATDEELSAAQRPHLAIGAGVERRFNRFALQLELRALAVGQTEDEMQRALDGGMTSDGLTGGNVSLGASYYF